jgi:hypothetical protein
VVKRFAALGRGLDKNFHLLTDGRLSDILVQTLRTQRALNRVFAINRQRCDESIFAHGPDFLVLATGNTVIDILRDGQPMDANEIRALANNWCEARGTNSTSASTGMTVLTVGWCAAARAPHSTRFRTRNRAKHGQFHAESSTAVR